MTEISTKTSSANLINPSNANGINDILANIIKLQLKKPKRWNWELTTSRSSPYISLPIVQLYDAKGKVLAQTTDERGSGVTITRGKNCVEQRRSWHSNDVVGDGKEKDGRVGVLKCQSEKNVVGSRTKPNQKRCPLITHNLNKSSSQNDTAANERDNTVRGRGQYLNRSGSDGKVFRIIEQQQQQQPSKDAIARIRSLRERIQDESATLKKYHRSRSDDLSKRHKQLVTIANDKSDPTARHHHRRYNKYAITEEELSDDKHLLDIDSAVKRAARYDTRTSSAGTLIIRIDSIDRNDEVTRRRRKNAPEHLEEHTGRRFVDFPDGRESDIRRSKTAEFGTNRKQVPHEIRRRKTNEMGGAVYYEQHDKDNQIKTFLDKIKQRDLYSKNDQYNKANEIVSRHRLSSEMHSNISRIPSLNKHEEGDMKNVQTKESNLGTNGLVNGYNTRELQNIAGQELNYKMLNKVFVKYADRLMTDETSHRKLNSIEDNNNNKFVINSETPRRIIKYDKQQGNGRKTEDLNSKHQNIRDSNHNHLHKRNNFDNNKALPLINSANDVVKRSQSERHDRHIGLFYSMSDVFPFKRLLEPPEQEVDANSDYLRQDEAVGSDSDRLDDVLRFRAKARLMRRLHKEDRRRGTTGKGAGEDAEAAGVQDDDVQMTEEHRWNARIVKDHRAALGAPTTVAPSIPTASSPTTAPTHEDFVNLVVQHLTNNQHNVSAPPPAEASMGANVSRHNSKGGSGGGGGGGGGGLSAGRRSQSSGSIYSRRKGNRATAPIEKDGGSEKGCGSLPGYFDLTGGNNNDDEENHQDGGADGVDGSSLNEDTSNTGTGSRIPPLGDASGGGGGGAPLHWKFSDGPPNAAAPCSVRINNGGAGVGHHHHHHQVLFCDQGYGSERSPEEEYPPPLLGSAGGMDGSGEAVYHQLELHSCYPFITPESTFTVSLAKGSRGLGLSVTGGIDSGGSWPGLIRVKRLFPHQPAAACGCLSVGDLIIEANGVPLTGLTNYEALEVLRTAPAQVDLRICRPPPDVLNCVSPISEVPPPPPTRRDQPPSSLNLSGGITSDDDYHGEFEITMRKMQGSLGFTLRKEDDSALGHYIRALVREPALKDGRIRPGDKIIAVNDKEISDMSHEEAVQFLRQCGDLVKLRLYRDAAQTPIATLSPTETTPRTSFCRKAQLRQEAVDMLNDIAVRKLLPNQQQPSDSHRSTGSPTTSPRRIRRALTSDSSSTNSVKTYATLTEEQFHEALLHDGVYHSGHIPLDEESFNSLFIQDDEDDPDKPSRPASLDLYNPNQTPVAARKPKFNFSLAHNAYELNNLDAEILDAPNFTYHMNENLHSAEVESADGYPHEPASMPHIPTEPTFSYKNPAYQSAHPTCTMSAPASTTMANENGTTGDGTETIPHRGKSGGDGGRSQDRDRAAMVAPIVSGEESEMESGTIRRRRKPILKESKPLPEEEPKILAIELNRGWNSRLGFSLQGAAGVTYVSAVHADSVAARDGRIKPGDRVIKVNDENVDHLGTNEIIDLLRIMRGPVCIVVSRRKAAATRAAVGASVAAVTQDCLKSNAVN